MNCIIQLHLICDYAVDELSAQSTDQPFQFEQGDKFVFLTSHIAYYWGSLFYWPVVFDVTNGATSRPRGSSGVDM